MNITLENLKQILNLVGKLDDSPGAETPRERFRHFLKENVTQVGQIRDYVSDCLANSGDSYNRALQDLVNHLGEFLGFSVTFGRYHGVQGEIGFDGLWKSTTENFYIVIEVKTSEVYPIRPVTLVGYVDKLISEKQIPGWDYALGLYVVGRPDPEIRQLENAILAEKRIHQLRIISVESLLTLAEIMKERKIQHEAILAVIRPSGPTLNAIVALMNHLAGRSLSSNIMLASNLEGGSHSPVPPDEAATVKDLETSKTSFKRLPRGTRTPEASYRLPILRALDALGGEAPVSDVLERVYAEMESLLKPVDLDPLPSDPKNPRWRNTAFWQRQRMVDSGLLRHDAPRGRWAISEQGREYLKTHGE